MPVYVSMCMERERKRNGYIDMDIDVDHVLRNNPSYTIFE